MKIVGRVQKSCKNAWKLRFLIVKTYSTPKNTYENIQKQKIHFLTFCANLKKMIYQKVFLFNDILNCVIMRSRELNKLMQRRTK